MLLAVDQPSVPEIRRLVEIIGNHPNHRVQAARDPDETADGLVAYVDGRCLARDWIGPPCLGLVHLSLEEIAQIRARQNSAGSNLLNLAREADKRLLVHLCNGGGMVCLG